MAQQQQPLISEDEMNQLRVLQQTAPSGQRGGMRDYVSTLMGGAKMLGTMASDAVTGDKQKTGNFPEFQPWDADLTGGLAAVLGNLSAADGLGYANIMKEWLPDAGVTFDANNNPLIKWRGKTYYANKPGVSGNDAMRLATDMAAYWPAARWAEIGRASCRERV